MIQTYKITRFILGDTLIPMMLDIVYIMAAGMNGLVIKQGSSLVSLLILCNFFIYTAASTTTPPTSSNGAVTGSTNPPTTPISSTSPQAQTTTPVTATPSPIPVNTDLAYCPCDLTGNACDVNCCCDGDCTSDDRLAFSECLPISINSDERLCMRSELILFDNSPYISNFTSDNLFCLYFDNNAARNYYTIPDLVTTQETFNSYVRDYSDFSFQSSPPSQTNYSDYYKSGDEIYVVYDSRSQGVLALPAALSSTLCTDGNPAAYLIDSKTECIRSVSAIATKCTSLPSLSANTYYLGFRVVTAPALFQKYVPTNNTNSTVDLDSVSDLYNNTYTIPVTLGTVRCVDVQTGLIGNCNISQPSLNPSNQRCQNTVVQVDYRIKHDGTKGISEVMVDVLLGSITTSTTLYSQTFSISFDGVNQQNPFVRSGNPGYRQGEPLMAGTFNSTTDADGNLQQEIILNSNRKEWLTIETAAADGKCSSTSTNQDRLSVQFGEDVRSGCFIQITLTGVTDYCELLQQRIINALEGDQAPIYNTATGLYSSTNRYVATFGNSDTSKVGDWILLQVQNRPQPSPAIGQRCSLSLGMSVQVLYANVGSLSNPQSKILGVAFVYDQVEDVYYRCTGPYCQPGVDLSQKLEITSSVTFIDVSQPAVGFEAEAPLFLAKVPYDFFYPFLSGAACANHQCILVVLFTVLFSLYQSIL